jgi:DNA-binding protein HU-beta
MIDLRTEPSNIFGWFCFIQPGCGLPAAPAKGETHKHMAEVKKMTQTQVVNEIATAAGITKKQAKAAMEKLVDLAIAQTKKVGVFVLPGIGRLKRVERKARMGRNPATGEPIKIPARKSVKLTLSKSIKDAIVPPKPKK